MTDHDFVPCTSPFMLLVARLHTLPWLHVSVSQEVGSRLTFIAHQNAQHDVVTSGRRPELRGVEALLAADDKPPAVVCMAADERLDRHQCRPRAIEVTMWRAHADRWEQIDPAQLHDLVPEYVRDIVDYPTLGTVHTEIDWSRV